MSRLYGPYMYGCIFDTRAYGTYGPYVRVVRIGLAVASRVVLSVKLCHVHWSIFFAARTPVRSRDHSTTYTWKLKAFYFYSLAKHRCLLKKVNNGVFTWSVFTRYLAFFLLGTSLLRFPVTNAAQAQREDWQGIVNYLAENVIFRLKTTVNTCNIRPKVYTGILPR